MKHVAGMAVRSRGSKEGQPRMGRDGEDAPRHQDVVILLLPVKASNLGMHNSQFCQVAILLHGGQEQAILG